MKARRQESSMRDLATIRLIRIVLHAISQRHEAGCFFGWYVLSWSSSLPPFKQSQDSSLWYQTSRHGIHPQAFKIVYTFRGIQSQPQFCTIRFSVMPPPTYVPPKIILHFITPSVRVKRDSSFHRTERCNSNFLDMSSEGVWFKSRLTPTLLGFSNFTQSLQVDTGIVP
jgi:hypothetical protein